MLFFDDARSDAALLEVTPVSCFSHNVGGANASSSIFCWIVFLVEATKKASSTDYLLDATADAAP